MSFFNRKPEQPAILRSQYFPEKFFESRSINLDDSVEYFVRKSIIKLPTTPLFVDGFKNWHLEQDQFEEVLFEEDKYKLVYDKTNEVFYFLQKVYTGNDANSASAEAVEYSNHQYAQWSGALDIRTENKLLAIFNREISKEADEYMFVELLHSRGTYAEVWWVGVIVQPGMIL